MSPPTLLSLPDELLVRIYAQLLRVPPPSHSGAPTASRPALRGRALHDHAVDAFAFAQTSRRLLRVFSQAALPSLAPHVHYTAPAAPAAPATAAPPTAVARTIANIPLDTHPLAALSQLLTAAATANPANPAQLVMQELAAAQSGMLQNISGGAAAVATADAAVAAAVADVTAAAATQARLAASMEAMVADQAAAGVLHPAAGAEAAAAAARAQSVASAAQDLVARITRVNATNVERVKAMQREHDESMRRQRRLGLAPPATCDVAHVRAMVRLAGADLAVLILDAYPPDRLRAYQSFLPAPPILRVGERAAQMDPRVVLEEIVERKGGVGGLDELRLVHPRPQYSIRAATWFWKILMGRARRGMRAITVVHAETRMGRALVMAALGEGGEGGGIDTADWVLPLRQWRLPRGPLPASTVPLTELRLPAFAGGDLLLAALIETYGSTLRTLEVSVLSENIANLPSAPPPLPVFASVDEQVAFWERVVARCVHLDSLHLGDLTSSTRPLGPCLVEVSRGLQSLSLDGMSGQLADPRCHALALIRAADAHCPELDAIHMIDCQVTGESAALFQAVGARLRTFTGYFSWETSGELLTFAAHCPNVQSLSMRCGDSNPESCDEGAVQVCRRLGANLRSLVLCNLHIAEASFLAAACAATGVAELELVCSPKLGIAQTEQILAAVGKNLRVLTIAWPRIQVEAANDGSDDFRLLEVISEQCPLLESLCIPELWFDADILPNSPRLEAAVDAIERVKSRLPFLDRTDCNIDKHIKTQLVLA